MTKNNRNSLWGLRWIFLRDEKTVSHSKKYELPSIPIDLTDEVDDMPDLILNLTERSPNVQSPFTARNTKLERMKNYNFKDFRRAKISAKKAQEDLPSLTMRSARSGTLKVRKVVFPSKTRPKIEKPERDSSFNRRKHYGKWYLRPNAWNSGLQAFKLSAKLK